MARDDLATAADLACPKCRMFGCDCNPPEAAHNRPAMADTCTVCHRPKPECICRSHVATKPLGEDHVRSGRVVRHLSQKEVEGRVNEAVHAYYDRDPKALAALVRGWFE